MPAPASATAPSPSREKAAELLANVETVITGKTRPLEYTLAALLSRNHVLFEDVPGVGKTTISKALAISVSCQFDRIQATSDLLPSDVLGTSMIDPESRELRFFKGPVFTNFLLVDEINRATPRTQSALLEAMSERQVTIDRTTYGLERPFFVIATQNPAEQVGTYFLPESQLDRFALRLEVGYPDLASEKQILARREGSADPLQTLEAVCTTEELIGLQDAALQVTVSEAATDYLLRIVHATRNREGILTGVSPRGALTYMRVCQGLAYLRGRSHVLADDIQELAAPVLAHRLLLASRLRSHRRDQERIVDEILDEVPCP